MRHFAVQRFARLALYVTLSYAASACGADSDRDPPIGAPTGPGPVVSEGGTSSGAGSAGQPGANPSAGAATDGTAGASNLPGTGGNSSFGTGGNGSAGRDPFGIGGSGNNPFGIGGSPGSSAGTSFF